MTRTLEQLPEAAHAVNRAAAESPAPLVMPQLSPSDLADLLGAFNDASRKLQESHEALRAEVVRLKSELREANEQLERSRRLAALGEMAAGISHEVRNPLGSIRLYAKMLVDDLVDRPGERAVAEKIGVAVRGLDAVVGDVLAFAREMVLRPARHDARELLERALDEVLAGARAEAGESMRAAGFGLDVRWIGAGLSHGVNAPLREAEPVEVWCDAALTHRALVNILRNAVDAVREAGASVNARPHAAIVLEVGERALPEHDGSRKRWCVLSVRDTGGGIPADAMKRIFNPFFTTRATGTGLGLAIVHRIMDAHAGRVSVRNVPADAPCERFALGAGALVELHFPLAAPAQVDGDFDTYNNSADASTDESLPLRGHGVNLEDRQGTLDSLTPASRRADAASSPVFASLSDLASSSDSASSSGAGASSAGRASSVCMEAS